MESLRGAAGGGRVHKSVARVQVRECARGEA